MKQGLRAGGDRWGLGSGGAWEGKAAIYGGIDQKRNEGHIPVSLTVIQRYPIETYRELQM